MYKIVGIIILLLWGPFTLVMDILNKGGLYWGSIRYDPFIKKFGKPYIRLINIIMGIISITAGIFLCIDG